MSTPFAIVMGGTMGMLRDHYQTSSVFPKERTYGIMLHHRFVTPGVDD